MTYYKQSGKIIHRVTPDVPTYDRLPAGTFVLKFNPELGFYFEVIDDFTLPIKTYGDLFSNRDRIINTLRVKMVKKSTSRGRIKSVEA